MHAFLSKRWLNFGPLATLICLMATQSSASGTTCDAESLSASIVRELRTCPNQILHLVVGYNAGGNTHTLGLHFTQYLRRLLDAASGPRAAGMNVVLEPRPGASGELASRFVANSDPQFAGCRLLVAQSNQLTTNQFGVSQPVDPEIDLKPIALLGESPLVLVVNPLVSPHKTFADFRTYLETATDRRRDFYGSNGNYATDHLAIERLLSAIGARGTHVPFTGSAPMLQDLLSNSGSQTDFAFAALGLIRSRLEDGSLLGLGIARDEELRLARPGKSDIVIPPLRREVSSFGEASIWVALTGSRHVSDDSAALWSRAVACFARDIQVRSVLEDQMMFSLGGSAHVIRRKMDEEIGSARRIFVQR